jgi:hypothetical protein
VGDVILILSTGVSYINFIGGVSEQDKEAVIFLNKISAADIPLEIVELEIKM